MTPGPHNAITDVPGVRVGHVTIWADEPAPPSGTGVARTGVTAIVPDDPSTLFDRPLAAGGATLNAAGELTGYLQISEWGSAETPVYLTGHDAGRSCLRRRRCRRARGGTERWRRRRRDPHRR